MNNQYTTEFVDVCLEMQREGTHSVQHGYIRVADVWARVRANALPPLPVLDALPPLPVFDALPPLPVFDALPPLPVFT